MEFKFTQEQIDNRKSDYVCFDCGVLFLREDQKKGHGNAITFHQSECCLCEEDKSVTHIRAYNRLRIPQQK